MPTQFLHISDVHLGNQQYGLRERFNDFGHSFLAAIDFAVDRKVDLVIISGDLFHKSAIDPPTLLQAMAGLDKLRQARIRAVAVAGNHDRARYRDRTSWLDFLAERGDLVLLSPTFTDDGLVLQPWDGSEGAYIDLGPVRIVGIPYYGASVRTVIAGIPAALAELGAADTSFTVLVAHAGVEGEMPGVVGGLTQNDLAPLRGSVNYLALGHLHKPFDREGWIYNPGSLEACGMDERHWHGGFCYVTLPGNGGGMASVQHVKNPRRRGFHRLTFAVDRYHTADSLYNALRSMIAEQGASLQNPELPPVIEVVLEGVLGFDRGKLDREYIERLTAEILSPLVVRVVNNSTPPGVEAPKEGDFLERSELELRVLRELALRDATYSAHADDWASLIVEVKRMLLGDRDPQDVASLVRRQMTDLQQGGSHVDNGS